MIRNACDVQDCKYNNHRAKDTYQHFAFFFLSSQSNFQFAVVQVINTKMAAAYNIEGYRTHFTQKNKLTKQFNKNNLMTNLVSNIVPTNKKKTVV